MVYSVIKYVYIDCVQIEFSNLKMKSKLISNQIVGADKIEQLTIHYIILFPPLPLLCRCYLRRIPVCVTFFFSQLHFIWVN